MTDDLKQYLSEEQRELLRKSRVAAPGPWRSPWPSGSTQKCAGVDAGDHYIFLNEGKGYHEDTYDAWKCNADYIAAASPDVIQALLTELAESKKKLAERTQERDDAMIGQRLRQQQFNTMADLADEAIEDRDRLLRGEPSKYT